MNEEKRVYTPAGDVWQTILGDLDYRVRAETQELKREGVSLRRLHASDFYRMAYDYIENWEVRHPGFQLNLQYKIKLTARALRTGALMFYAAHEFGTQGMSIEAKPIDTESKAYQSAEDNIAEVIERRFFDRGFDRSVHDAQLRQDFKNHCVNAVLDQFAQDVEAHHVAIAERLRTQTRKKKKRPAKRGPKKAGKTKKQKSKAKRK